MSPERQESRAAIRAATAQIRKTCNHVAVPVMTDGNAGGVGGSSSATLPMPNAEATVPVRKDFTAGRVLPKVILAAIIIAIIAMFAGTPGCAFSPEGLQSAGEALQTAAPVVNDIVPGPSGDLLELILGGAGTLLVLGGGLWAKSRKAAAVTAMAKTAIAGKSEAAKT